MEYEMRMSDWSSDVCFSDLVLGGDRHHAVRLRRAAADRGRVHRTFRDAHPCMASIRQPVPAGHGTPQSQHGDPVRAAADRPARLGDRSEEHTSELQSPIRISYAVFCLKKKTITTH